MLSLPKNVKKYCDSVNLLKKKWSRDKFKVDNIIPSKLKILPSFITRNSTNESNRSIKCTNSLSNVLRLKQCTAVHSSSNSFKNSAFLLANEVSMHTQTIEPTVELKEAISSVTPTEVLNETAHNETVDVTTVFSDSPALSDTPVLNDTSTLSETLVSPALDTVVCEPATTTLIDPIPEPPVITEILQSLSRLGEPTFESLGLGGWSPVGIVQNCLEYLHVTLDVPWWGAIAIGTVIVRILMFPLVILAQRNGAKMNNYMPQMQVLQMKMTEARQTGNQLDAARYGQEMMMFMKEKQLNPLKNLLVPLAQMPLFVSFFVGLRQMANTPVDSLRTGGMLWFPDLTLPDQYLLLPIITSATMYLTIEIGTDSARLSAQNLQIMKYVLRALPLFVLPFTVNFPGAILCYWTCSNFISLAQVGVLRIPSVREYFKIEKMLVHKVENLPVKPKGFVKGVKDSWTNIKITNELEGRKRYDEMQFQRAGKGPIIKTYKYDPTKAAPMKTESYSTKK